MRTIHRKSAMIKIKTALAATLLLSSGGAALAQSVNLTAAPTTTMLSDGSVVPMWGYSCGATVSGSTATCSALNLHPNAGTTWSPVVITVPTGQGRVGGRRRQVDHLLG